MAKKLGMTARTLLNVIEEHFPGEMEIEVERLVSKSDFDRPSVVVALKELADAGHGVFTVGRRGAPSRFAANGGTPKMRPTPRQHDAVATDQWSLGPAEPDEQVQTLLLKRETPLKVTLPADLSPDEAQKIIEWIKVVYL